MAQETVLPDVLSDPGDAVSGVLADLSLPRRGLTRAQYDALVDAGLLQDWPVELLEGVMADVVPQGDPHSRGVRRLDRWLQRHLSDEWMVMVQSPLAATDDSEPEPDVAVILEPERGHPTTAALVIEVAVSSRRTDLVHKPRIYAAAGVEQYWVVDHTRREVVVHTGPVVDDAGARYAHVQRLPWSTPLRVLGLDVDLEAILTS